MLHYATIHIIASTSLLFYTAFGYQSPSSYVPNILYDIFMSGEFPGHSGIGIPLYSRNVLVLLQLWDGARSCIIACIIFYSVLSLSHMVSRVSCGT